MNRDELILSCKEIVNNLVKKYNNHKLDEDLQSIGMIAVIECVDRSLSENMTDVNQIQARCNVWARNKILTEIYKEKIKYTDDENALELYEAPEDLVELIVSVKQSLTPKQLRIFELLLEGYSKDEIMKKVNITRSVYFKHVKKIKEKILIVN